MKKNKITILIVTFLLLIPFRLPISILLIHALDYIAQLGSSQISFEILQANVILSKLIYNASLSIMFVYNIEMGLREYYGRKAKEFGEDRDLFIYTAVLVFLFFIYLCFDGYWTHELYLSLNN